MKQTNPHTNFLNILTIYMLALVEFDYLQKFLPKIIL